MGKGKLHRKFHSLFDNQTPVESLHFLFEIFWNKDYRILEKFLKEVKDDLRQKDDGGSQEDQGAVCV